MIGLNDAFMISILIIFIILCLVFFIVIYNRIVQLKNNINRAWSNVDVSLKQRHNELPNLMNIVKGYMTYEKNLLETISKARSYLIKEKNISKKAAASDIISESLMTLFAVAEKYPDLKAIENFAHLQNRITALENEIADRREYYNDCVTFYNIRIESFPDLLIARMMKFKREELFKATEEEKINIKINF
jgi:LemA protein